MKPVGLSLDPTQFTIVRHVAIVDEFVMTNDDGSFVANIDAGFLRKLAAHMNDREATTGDLCPVVIGHTTDGAPEITQPPVVGYLRNWSVGPFFDTNREAAYADFWVMNDEVERVRKFPRRSAEIWVTRYEADPVSLLGATTPARDLGLLKLSRDGSLTYEMPGELNMPDEKKNEPKADDKTVKNSESSGTKMLEDKMDQILAALSSLTEKLGGGAEPKAGPGEPTPGPDGAAGGSDDLTDEEIEKLLNESGSAAPSPEPMSDAKDSRKGEPEPVKNNAYCGPGGDNTMVPDMVHKKLQRLETDHAATQNELAVLKVQGELYKLQRQGYAQCNPDDAALVQDLAAMPPEIRTRSIERLKLSRTPGQRSHNLESALDNAGTPTGRKLMTKEDLVRLSRKALAEKTTFEAAAAAEGFTF